MNYNMLALQFLGIILVVIGHKGGIFLFDNFFPFYSFHMPLFIFISGYFFNADRSIKDFLKKKLKTHLLPLFLWNIFYLFLSCLLRYFDIIKYGSEFSLTSIFIDPITTGNPSGLNEASWFVAALFLTSLFYILIRKLLKILLKKEYLITLIFFIICLSGIYFAINGYNYGLYITVTRIAMYLFFYQLGYLYKIKFEHKDKLNSWLYFSILIVVQLILIYFYDDLSFINQNMVFVNKNIILPIITSITGILFWLRIAKIISNIVKNNKIACYIGENTFTVMMHHQFIFFLINLILLFVNNNIINIKGFVVEAFKYEMWYSYKLDGKYQFLILYVILGFLVPLILKFAFESIKKKRGNRKNEKQSIYNNTGI